MADDKLAALEELGLAQADAMRVMADLVHAVAVVGSVLIMHLGDAIDRGVIRDAALDAIGPGEANAGAAALVEALVQDPAAAAAGYHADLTAALAEVPTRLN